MKYSMSGLGVYCSTERYISVCICDTGAQKQLYESFYEIEMYASSESWIIIFPLMYGLDNIWNLESEGAKHLNIEKIIFKVF